MNEAPLTSEQTVFAAKHHGIIYKFLETNMLSMEEYYDIVVFGYLKSVRDYFVSEKLKQFSFSTIAWKSMFQSVIDHKRQQNKNKDIEIVSIHVALADGELPLEETLPDPGGIMEELERRLLLHDLAKNLSKQQMDIIRLLESGYEIREIACFRNLPLKHAKKQLENVRVILLKLYSE